mgnify:CR=1 FL=1
MAGERLLVYGANGFVGSAAARLARDLGLEPVAAGRDAEAVARVARELEVEARPFALDDPRAVARALEDARVVLNMAGPFVGTYRQLVGACLEAGSHYVDITGELPVLESMAGFDGPARERGVMLLPSAGLDSVPADCLAAHLARRLPRATRLRFALRTVGPAGLPPGTQRTMIALSHLPDRVVAGGRLVTAAGTPSMAVDFGLGDGPVTVVRYPGPDPFVAHRTTGVPDVQAFVALPPALRLAYRALRLARPLLRPEPVRRLLSHVVLPGPSEEARARSSTHTWAEARDDAGGVAAARLHGPEGAVEWTVRLALAVARRALAGDAPPGLQTPAGAYGADLVLECEGVTREDVT